MSLKDRLQSILGRIEKASHRSKWGPRTVTLMGATKGQSLNQIRAAADLGVLDMGENYAQELLMKAPLCLDTKIRWHFIGRLQSNKVKHLIHYVSTICSLDSIELAEKISRAKESLEVSRATIPCLLQVNLGSERQKSGLPPAVVESLFSELTKVDGISIAGLMCIPPVSKDPEKTRIHFRQMKEFFDRLRQNHPKPEMFQVLSMGMSSDFEVAIEEGANLVRIGEALFGPRPKEIAEE